ncbi:LacI family DNA-binding transcriptional regulator [Vibrio parahaemolyticus]|nr:LacI family DNA-binding transcriptional regulator [Vibrio parahaemolyticus]
MANIELIAKLSGTSRGTVSRVLNNGSVSKNTREKVERVIADIGYEPSQTARSLRAKRSGLIGLVIPTFSGGFFGNVMHELQSRLLKDDRMLTVIEGLSVEGELEAVNRLIKMNCDGIILDSRYLGDDELRKLVDKTNVPLVLLDRYIADISEICFHFDHYGTAKKMTFGFLVDSHRNIACISGALDRPNSLSRATGYIDAMKEHSLEPLLFSGDYTAEFGQATMNKISKLDERPTAIVCCSEAVAAGVLKECHQLGISIPDDISVITFDTYRLCDLLQPTIPYELFPIVEMSIDSLNKLNELIKKES